MTPELDFAHKTASRAESIATKAEERLSSHELICAERYTKLEFGHTAIVGRASRIEWLLYGVIFFLMIGEGSILEVVKRVAFKGG